DRMRAVLDDAVLERPALAPAVLEIQVPEIDAGAEQAREGAVQASEIEAGRGEQPGRREVEGAGVTGREHSGACGGGREPGGRSRSGGGGRRMPVSPRDPASPAPPRGARNPAEAGPSR